ncbi:MAG TPA: hypothetical protein V6C86_12260 [Oculatellaceae cyanobacterium]
MVAHTPDVHTRAGSDTKAPEAHHLAGSELAANYVVHNRSGQDAYHAAVARNNVGDAAVVAAGFPPGHQVLGDAPNNAKPTSATDVAPPVNTHKEEVSNTSQTTQEAVGFKPVVSTVGTDQTRKIDVTHDVTTTKGTDQTTPASSTDNTSPGIQGSNLDISNATPPKPNTDVIDARASLPQTAQPEVQNAANIQNTLGNLPARPDMAT